MKKCFCVCPDCGGSMVFCPELIHREDHRPIFMCYNVYCENYTDILRDRNYMVLGNIDNFGSGVDDT